MINKEQIGRRLAMLREELACPGEDTWSQGRLADATGLTRNMVLRLEKAGNGSLEGCLALLFFYHQRGYNLNWILLPDNSMVSKMKMSDENKSIDATLVLEKLTSFKQALDKDVHELVECLTA
jgi:transcriptional regulator with XRE-family HTH domain